MSNSKIINLLTAEGYQGQDKKTFEYDPWMDIYASIQNNVILQDYVSAIEEHTTMTRDGEKAILCLVIMLGGTVKALIPAHETGLKEESDQEMTERQLKTRMRNLVGQQVAFKVKGIDRESNLCVCSRKEALQHMSGVTWKDIKVGDIKVAVVRHVQPYYAIVNVGGIETKLPASEMSWGWVNDARKLFAVGDSFDVKVIEIDEENKKIKVSLKELLTDNWQYVPEKYIVNGEYCGFITGIEEWGFFVNLEPGVDAKVNLPKSERVRNEMKIGRGVLIRIYAINPEKRHISARMVKLLPTSRS